MKSYPVLLALWILAAGAPTALAQGGPLTPPPGVPAPTMKSLDQVEPSRPLVAGAPGVTIAPSGTITIAQPGAWHLVDNLTVTSGDGISITSDNVTLDLRGFTIATTGSGGIGINISGRTRIAISNGHIRSGTTYSGSAFTPAGFTGGIDYSGGAPGIIRIADVSIEGTQNYGIDLGTALGGIVESCVVRTTSVTGIRAAVVTDCVAIIIGTTPIVADVATGCVGRTAAGTALISSNQPSVKDLKDDTTALLATAEKRTPISSVPITISTPGSYYLTQNLSVTSGNAITITTGGVTLDLNGFRISSSANPASGKGVEIVSGASITGGVIVRNGHIGRTTPTATGTGFEHGVYSLSYINFAVQCDNLHVMDTSLGGIDLNIGNANRTIVKNCIVRNIGITTLNASYGIHAHVISHCTVDTQNGDAIFGISVENCVAASATSRGIVGQTVLNSVGRGVGNGILGTYLVRGSRGVVATGFGIDGEVVTDCAGEATSGTAISGRQISNCYAKATTGTGINTTGTASFCRAEVNSGAVAITGLHAYACTVSAGSLNNATQKNFCY